MGKRTNLKILLAMSAVLVGFHCTIATAGVIYVDDDANGLNNGSSWANAYNYLQDALADPNLFGPAEIWVAQGTYYPDANSSNPPSVEDLVTTGLSIPYGIALDVPGGKMYWTDYGTDKIQRANLDGSSVEDLVTTGLSYTIGIALDDANGKMYWTDYDAAWTGKIQRANMSDGSIVEDLVTTSSSAPRGIALDVAGGKMYWTDYGTDKIRRANMSDGSSVEDLVTTGLMGTIGIALDVAAGKMYWVDVGTDKIQRANMDGSGVEDLVTAPSYPAGIVLDVAASKMYWTDVDYGKIRRANLDGSSVEDLVTSGLSGPAGIALDVAAGKMYWTDIDTDKIQRASMFGGGSGLRTETFQLIDGVAIYGGFPSGGGTWEQRDPNAYETILSGDIGTVDVNSDNSYHVVTGSGTDSTAALDGFTITAGNANGSSLNDHGGGMFNDSGSPTVTNCTFSSNSASGAGGSGGGMFNGWSSSPTLTDCTFSGNSAEWGGGGIASDIGSSPTLTNCTFSENWAGNHGGGMANWSFCSPNLTDCTFSSNEAGNHGGGMNNAESCGPTLTNCTFSRNSVTFSGGGMYNWDSSPILTNCILWGDTATDGNEIALVGSSTIDVNYCDVQGGQTDIYNDGTGTVNWGIGNIAVDPCFVDANNSDYHLQAGSPCIDAGDPHGDYVGQTDIDGEPRVIGFYVDIGSDESNDVIVADYYVDDDAPDDPGPGNPGVSDPLEDGSWQHPFDAIQEAITAATGGNIIGVRDGTYTGNGNRNIDFGGKAITVFSRGPENCIIDCEGAGRGFYFHSGEDGNSVVEGFTITNGYANPGGGIYCDNSSPMISKCTFSGNEGAGPGGGGVYCNYSSPAISNCTFSDNTAQYGGAIRCFHGPATINNCVINGNTADYEGGGICFYFTNSTVSNCTISGNVTGARGGGIFCYDSETIVSDSMIRDNSIDGIHLYDVNSTIQIKGVVEIISNNVLGEGFVQIDPNAILNLDDAEIFTNMVGAGTMEVDIGAELVIDGNAVIDLGDPYDPNVKGTIDCEGVLEVKDNAKITNANINITRASFTDDVNVSNSVITVDSNAPYGQFFIDANATFIYNDIYADGDRYMDLDPNIFVGLFVHNRIFVTITEGVGQTQGGLFECRGEDGFADVNSCDPNNIFFCRANPGSIPDCNMKTWTLERLELIAGAKLNLTNRFPFQPPYDPGTDYDVVYVKELILRQNSVLNTSFNKIYYGTLISEPNAAIKNVPLLGFSMINIAFDDGIEFIVRVMHNNYTHPNDPNYNRVHIERVEGNEPDPNGMMRMCNLDDDDPNSQTYEQLFKARTKGLFSKSGEDDILIWFEYLFETSEPNVELVVYLSDVPELLDHNDPNRTNHYIEVARLYPPPAGRPGSASSGRFGTFQQYVWPEDLDFVRGTRIEFELIGPDDTCILVNNWDPQVHCDGICMDLNYSDFADEEDYLIVIGECGGSAGITQDNSRACLDGVFSQDGYVDSYDIVSWDWSVGLWYSGQVLNLCPGSQLPLTSGQGEEGAAVGGLGSSGGPGPLVELPESISDLLISGKRGTTDSPAKLEDNFYIFDNNGLYMDEFEPALDRFNIRLVQDFDGNLYQINAETGLLRLDSNEVIVAPNEVTGVPEPRYGTTATVYVGIQGQGNEWFGRPILDAAFDFNFDTNNYVYVVPVVVDPTGEEPYTAAAKLELSPSSYSIVKLYDDPCSFNPNDSDNPNLGGLREIEADSAGNLYIVNAHSHNESDFLWRYDTDTAVVIERLDLGDPNSDNYIPDPIGMHLSSADDMLYLASSQNPAAADSTFVYGFSINGTLILNRSITINGMGHVTSITEDPITRTLWVAGFSMDDPPDYPDPYELPFYDPNLAEVPDGNNNVQALSLVGASDLALPLSIVWTGSTDICEGADLDASSDVDFVDFAILANQWHQSPGSPSADIAPEVLDGFVDMLDLAILAKHWLKTGCTSP